MSYRLVATGPCTVLLAGRQIRVEVGDPLHLTNDEAQSILNGGFGRYFTIISAEDPETPVEIATSTASINTEQQLLAPITQIEGDEQAIPLPLGVQQDPAKEVYEVYEAQGNQAIEAMVSTPSRKKSSKTKEVVKEEVTDSDADTKVDPAV